MCAHRTCFKRNAISILHSKSKLIHAKYQGTCNNQTDHCPAELPNTNEMVRRFLSADMQRKPNLYTSHRVRQSFLRRLRNVKKMYTYRTSSQLIYGEICVQMQCVKGIQHTHRSHRRVKKTTINTTHTQRPS